jgi:LPS-assembly protein
MSKRGAMLRTNYRYLSPTYSGTATIAYLPDDALTKTNRYSINFQHNQNFGDGFAGYINHSRLSDAKVTTDLNATDASAVPGRAIFQQEVGVTYTTGRWQVLAHVQYWRSFTAAPPYNREPEPDEPPRLQWRLSDDTHSGAVNPTASLGRRAHRL